MIVVGFFYRYLLFLDYFTCVLQQRILCLFLPCFLYFRSALLVIWGISQFRT